MEFKKNTIYKIVFKEDGVIKTPKGRIVDYDQILIKLEFDNLQQIFINTSEIISIKEVEKGIERPKRLQGSGVSL